MPPRRIQRKRAKDWRMPAGAVYVGRPTEWGNPFVVGVDGTADEAVWNYRESLTPEIRAKAKAELCGKDLVCWCRLDRPCHADVLLAIANA